MCDYCIMYQTAFNVRAYKSLLSLRLFQNILRSMSAFSFQSSEETIFRFSQFVFVV